MLKIRTHCSTASERSIWTDLSHPELGINNGYARFSATLPGFKTTDGFGYAKLGKRSI